MSTTRAQVWRLEMHDVRVNAYKHYTVILDPSSGAALFGYSRIGARWQWAAGRGASAAQKKIAEKTAKGYEETWRGDIDVPAEWLTATDLYGDQLKQAIDQARIEKRRSSFGTDVADEPSTPLASTIEAARDLVSKMAVDPDSAVAGYAALVADQEAIAADLSVVESYIDTLRIMLMAAGKDAA